MSVVKNIEQKIKINQRVSMFALIAAVVMVISGFVFSYNMILDSRKSIYVLDNGVPILVKQTDMLLNRPVEYKAQIDLFHQLFFTLMPDDVYIKENIAKALYLIDDSGMKEYTNLKEKGFYNQVISSNSVITVHADSLKFNEGNKKFIYYATQAVNRKTALITRNLITEGSVEDVPRSPQNPHGVLIRNWKIIENKDISKQEKANTY